MRPWDVIAALSGAAALVATVVSFSSAQTPFHPPLLKQFLEENGWVSLPLPNITAAGDVFPSRMSRTSMIGGGIL
jgi:hypothetical protein